MDYAPKISVIIPCYNVEKYLSICLNSLENQTFKDFEVLLIDDGSTDSTGKIAKSFANKNPCFRYYLTDNKGPGEARNLAIRLARGEYLAFVDSDDSVSPFYLEKLYTTAVENDADIVCCNYNKYYDRENVYYRIKFRKQKQGVYSNEKMMKLLLNDWTVRSYLWNKFFKKSLFTDNELFFPNMYFEDIVNVFRLCYYAKKTVAIPDTLYNYSIRENSIMTTYNADKYNDYAKAYYLCLKFTKEKNVYRKMRLNFLRTANFVFFANSYMTMMMHLKERKLRGMFKNMGAAMRTVFRLYFSKKPFIVNGNVPYPIRFPDYFAKNKDEVTPEQTVATAKAQMQETLEQ